MTAENNISLALPLSSQKDNAMYETKNQPIASFAIFAKRICLHLLMVAVVVLIALGMGIYGFHHLENMPWIDAFENSAMILSTMGPVQPTHTPLGKIFSAFYALFSGLIFITLAGIFFAPILHRFLHKFHHDKSTSKH